jgi:hypothetical protein
MRETLVKNWRTSAGGILAFVIGGLTYTQVITTEQASALTSLVAGVGLLFAKDAVDS